MTGKERINAIFNYQKTDRLSWTILSDEKSLKSLPANMKNYDSIDLCRHFGCDVYHWAGLGLGSKFSLQNPVSVLPETEITEEIVSADKIKRTYASKWGQLYEIYAGCHPVSHLLNTIDEVRTFKKMWEGCYYKLIDESEKLLGINRKIGQDGVLIKSLNGSTIPVLLENFMGMENFYYLKSDYPEELKELIKLMHEKDIQRFELAAAESGTDYLLLTENTSTTYISPQIYQEYNFNHVRDFCGIVHKYNKKAIIHMCGHIKKLLPFIRGTGLDGIDALTPLPIGNTRCEDVLDLWGDKNIFLMPIFDPVALNLGEKEQIFKSLDRLYTSRLRDSHIILCLFVDGIDIPLDKIAMVADWFDRNGIKN